MEGLWIWIVLFYLILGAILAYICYKLAIAKKYENASSYAWLGFFFGMIVLIYVAGLPDLYVRDQVADMNNRINRIHVKLDENTSQGDFDKSEKLTFDDLPKI